MKVSQRTEYGLRAMVALALLAGEERPIPLSAIAQSEAIPEQFLDQIVARLRKGGFVRSVRGVNGGYLLNRPPEEITVGSLVRLLEGSLAPMGCVSDLVVAAGAAEEFCGLVNVCHTRNVWLRVMDVVTQALDSLSLAEVMRDEVPLRVQSSQA